MTVCAIHQLHYLPWLRYFEKIARSDVFIVLDDAQFTKNDWHNRNKIKAADGELILTVPVLHKHGQLLSETLIDNSKKWRAKHWAAIRQNYSKAPFFPQHAPALEDFYAQQWERLNDLNGVMLAWFLDVLGIRTRIVYATDLDASGHASERLAKLCRAVNADRYYCGAFAAEQYLEMKYFDGAGVKVELQHWTAPVYTQQHPQIPFTKDLAVLDLLLNEGPRSLDILLGK